MTLFASSSKLMLSPQAFRTAAWILSFQSVNELEGECPKVGALKKSGFSIAVSNLLTPSLQGQSCEVSPIPFEGASYL